MFETNTQSFYDHYAGQPMLASTSTGTAS